jgi:hypothetical protein
MPKESERINDITNKKDRALRVITTRIITRKGIQGMSDVEIAPSYDPSQHVGDLLANNQIEFRKNP